MRNFVGLAVSRMTGRIAAKGCGMTMLAVLLLLSFGSTGWAQGLTAKNCVVNGATIQAYLCLDDIVVVDGSGFNPAGTSKVGGLYAVDPVSGNQTPISTGGFLSQAASVTIEPGTGKLLASTRTYGVVRVNPKDGSQEVLLRGGTGWGGGWGAF
jgi:hypothetical protein